MASKKKEKVAVPASSDERMKKADPLTEVEREELRLKIASLEEKLVHSKERLEELQAESNGSKTALEQQQLDQADIISYLKKEIEKKTVENTSLERKYVSLREAKENEDARYRHEVTREKATVKSLREQLEAGVNERIELEERLTEFSALKEQTHTSAGLIASLQAELASTKKMLAHSEQQLKIITAPESLSATEQGVSAVSLLLLEAIRAYPSKHLLLEQACLALQAVLAGDQKDDCVAVRKHGGVELVLDAMKQHPQHVGLQSSICGLLWKLALTDPPSRKSIVQEGGVQLILQAMKYHISSSKLQYHACGALRNLLVHDARDFSVSSQISAARPGELPPIAQSIGGRDDSGDGKRDRRGVPRAGGVRAMNTSYERRTGAHSGGMRGSRSVPSLPKGARGSDGSTGIRQDVAPLSPTRRDNLPGVTPAARDSVLEHALDLTLKSMLEHSDQSLVQEFGSGTLLNLLLANPSLKGYVVNARGVELVLKAMRAFPLQAGVQVNACAVVKELAAHPKTLEQMKSADARAELSVACANHPYNQELISTAREALDLL